MSSPCSPPRPRQIIDVHTQRLTRLITGVAVAEQAVFMVVCYSISRQWIRSLQCPILVDLDGGTNIDLLGILSVTYQLFSQH
ncbi:hypothetical protein ARMGADRAFT_604939 [Armillaria gallica]|uniref:Uncharacterized protein n=1 Tax=Armillaria gallica TaxID=47427 RepID=A0A2H3CNY8_ARMGA|nr:hypothetical protein ARMGADRAFT_604939 [Armillaria gallica]